METEKLNQLRKEIDTIDSQLLKLFEQRMKVVENVALFKKEHNIPILNNSREDAILEKISKEIKKADLLPYAEAYFKNLMELSKEYQKEYMVSCEGNLLKKHIFLIGMPGAGKTTIGKLLSQKLNLEFIDLDSYIKEKNHSSIEAMFEKGEAHFRKLESEALRDAVKLSPRVISTGGGIITREENVSLLKTYGTIIYIDRDVETIIKDIDVSHRPLLLEGKERLFKLYEERKSIYEASCDYRVKNDNTFEHIVDKIIATLSVKL